MFLLGFILWCACKHTQSFCNTAWVVVGKINIPKLQCYDLQIPQYTVCNSNIALILVGTVCVYEHKSKLFDIHYDRYIDIDILNGMDIYHSMYKDNSSQYNQ